MSLNMYVLWMQMGALARGVVVALLGMSIYSLTVAAERLMTYRRARRQSAEFALRAASLLEQDRVDETVAAARRYTHSHLAAVTACAITAFEKKRLVPRLPAEEALDAARRATERATLVAVAQFRRGTGSLASIGATAPFVGLFGTVVGIINAFDKMAKSASGGLPVVAGGISEALVTTAFGLLVALPAVWLYNHLSQAVERFQVEMTNLSSELLDRLIERQAEQG